MCEMISMLCITVSTGLCTRSLFRECGNEGWIKWIFVGPFHPKLFCSVFCEGCSPDWPQLTGYTWHSNSWHRMAHLEMRVRVLVAGSKTLQCVMDCQCCMNPKAHLWELSLGKTIRPGCQLVRQIVTLTNLCSSLSPSGVEFTQILLTHLE